ncbi:MAG TPA: hypothetical protein VJJ47_00125 [Candidatus Paceibacterota bacterium]
MKLGKFGIPKRMWDECSADQRQRFEKTIGAMPRAERAKFALRLLDAANTTDRILRQHGHKLARHSPKAAREASRMEGGSTTIGTTLAMRQLMRKDVSQLVPYPRPLVAAAS